MFQNLENISISFSRTVKKRIELKVSFMKLSFLELDNYHLSFFAIFYSIISSAIFNESLKL